MRMKSKLITTPLLLVICCAFAFVIKAQEAQEEKKLTIQKHDEVKASHTAGCDLGARLDDFAIQLQRHDEYEGYFIVYAPKGKGSGTSQDIIARITNYLVQLRGISASRIKFIEAGRYEDNKDAFLDMWLVPQGEDAPAPKEKNEESKSFSGKFYVRPLWDSFEFGEETGPTFGSVKFAAFADILNEQPSSKAYIVAYNGKESVTGAWRRVGNEAKEQLQNDYGIDGNRIEILFGGYEKEEGRIEYWILPKEAPQPVKRKKEKQQKETVKLWSYGKYLFEYEDRVKLMFLSFADILKEDKDLNAYIIVRIDQTEDINWYSPHLVETELRSS